MKSMLKKALGGAVAVAVAWLLLLSAAGNAVAAGAGLGVARTDWLQACFDGSRSCFNRYENVLSPETVGRLELSWRTHVGTDGSTAPVYANGKLLVGTAVGLAELDPATGAIIINYRSGPVSTTPAVIRGFDPQPDPPGKVIFGSSDGVLHGVSTARGELWQVGLGAAPTSPLAIQGVGDPTIRIVVGAGRTLFAFDPNGARLWGTVLEGGDISTPAAVAPSEPDHVLVAAGTALYALDAGTGAVLWRSVPSGAVLGAPSIGDPHILGGIGNPMILIGDQAGNLFSVDAHTGEVVSSLRARGPILASAAIGDPTIADPWVFAGDGGGNIYAIDQTDDFPPPIWQAALGGPVGTPPVLANGVVYVTTGAGIGRSELVALDQASGRVLFAALLPGGLASSPVVADGRVVVATGSGDILAYDGPDS
jgi:outer membrane protein assembly factor BamB